MKTLPENQQSSLLGGGFFDGFCATAVGAGIALSNPTVATALAVTPGLGQMVYGTVILANVGCFAFKYR